MAAYTPLWRRALEGWRRFWAEFWREAAERRRQALRGRGDRGGRRALIRLGRLNQEAQLDPKALERLMRLHRRLRDGQAGATILSGLRVAGKPFQVSEELLEETIRRLYLANPPFLRLNPVVIGGLEGASESRLEIVRRSEMVRVERPVILLRPEMTPREHLEHLPPGDMTLRRLESPRELFTGTPLLTRVLPAEFQFAMLAEGHLFALRFRHHEDVLHFQPFDATEWVEEEQEVEVPLELPAGEGGEGRGQILYLLLDVSQSMTGESAVQAAATACALLRAGLGSRSVYVMREFEAVVFPPADEPPRIARSPQEKVDAFQWLAHAEFRGQGTDIAWALDRATRDIIRLRRESPQDLGRAVVVLITDGASGVGASTAGQLALNDVELHVVMTGHKENPELRRMARTYTVLADLPQMAAAPPPVEQPSAHQ